MCKQEALTKSLRKRVVGVGYLFNQSEHKFRCGRANCWLDIPYLFLLGFGLMVFAVSKQAQGLQP